MRWPAAKLSFTDRYIILSVPSLTTTGEFRLERGEVLAIRELRGWFTRGFEILHGNSAVPRALLFRIWNLSKTREALVRRKWPLDPPPLFNGNVRPH